MLFSIQGTDTQDHSGLKILMNSFKKPLHFPLFLSYLAIIVSYLQALLLIVSIQLKMFYNRPSDQNLIYIVKYLTSIDVIGARDPIIDQEIGLLLILVYQALQFYLFAIVLIRTAIKKKALEGKLLFIFRLVIILNFYVLYLPIQSFIIQGIIQISDETIVLSVMDSDGFLGIGIFIMVNNFLISSLGHRAYSQIQDKDFFSKRNSKICSLAFFYKMIACFLLLFTKQDSFSKWTLVIFSVLYIISSYYIFFNEFIFYNLKIIKLIALIHGNLAIYGVIFFALAIWDELYVFSISKTTFVVWAILQLFGMIWERFHLRNVLLNALKLERSKIRSEADHFKKMTALKWIFNEGCRYNLKSRKKEKNDFQMMLIGIVKKHRKRCDDSTCPCEKVIDSQNDNSNYEDINIHKSHLNKVMRNIYEETLIEGINQVKNGNNIVLDKAYFHLKKEDNFLTSYLTLKQFNSRKRRNIPMYVEASIKILQKQVEAKMETKSGASRLLNGEKLKIIELIRHNKLVADMKSLMAHQTEKQLEFWDLLNEFTWNSTKLFKLGREIEEFRNKVENTWKKINTNKHNDILAYLLFGLYNSVINNNIIRSEKILKRIEGIDVVSTQNTDIKVSNENLHDSKNILVSIGMDREKLGIIDFCSKNIIEAFGYSHDELIGSNVGVLMPNYFRRKHQNFLLRYLTSKTNRLFNNHRFSFGFSKKGYAVPVNLYVSVYPSLKNGLFYLGIIRPVKDSKEYILLTNQGFIDSCTENVSTELGINLNMKRIHISEICTEFGKISETLTNFVLKKQTELMFITKGQEKKSLVEHEEIEYEKTSTLFVTKGDKTNINDRYEKSVNFLIDNRVDSVSPRKTTFVDTLGIETSFRVNNNKEIMTQTAFEKKLSLAEVFQNKSLYQKLIEQGEVLEFCILSDKNTKVYYHCQLSEEVFEESTLRILALSKTTKNQEVMERPIYKMNTKSMQEEEGIYASGIDLEGPKQTNDNIEDTFIDQAIPNEISQDVMAQIELQESARNQEKNKESDLAYKGKSTDLFIQDSLSPINKGFSQQATSLFTNHVSSFNFKKTNGLLKNQEQFKEMKESGLSKNNPQLIPPGTSGTEKPSKSRGAVNSNPIKKFFQQHTLHMKKDLENTSSAGTSSATSTNRVFTIVEKALSEWKKSNMYKSWLTLTITLSIISFVSLITDFLLVQMELSQIIEESQSLFHVGRRLNAFLELNYDLQLLELYVRGYVRSDRHVQDGISDYISYVHEDFIDNVQQMDLENSILRTYVDGLTKEFQDRLYRDHTEIKVIGETNQQLSTISLNTFDAIDKVTMFGVEISNTVPQMLYTKQLEMRSILDNSFNSLLEHLKKPYDIYASKIKTDFDQTESYFIISITIILSSFLLVFLHSTSELRIISKDTIRFWESLLRFDLRKAEHHKIELKVMLEGLRKNNSFNELFSDINKAKSGESTKFSYKHSSKGIFSKENTGGFLKKRHDWSNIRTYAPTLVPISIGFILITLTLAASKILILSESQKRDNFITVLETIFQTYQLEILTISSLYQTYAFGQSSTILYQPVKEFLNENLETIGDIQTFVKKFQSQGDARTDSMLQDNLCQSIFVHINTTFCETAGNGANTKGLSNIISFITSNMEIIDDYYDQNINQSNVVNDTLSLNALRDVETELNFIQYAFELIGSNLEAKDKQEQENFSKWFFTILFLALTLELVVWGLLVIKAYRNLCSHKENHALVMKNIPVMLIWESKLLRNYIFTLFRGTFQNIKNKT